jgi:hypothetical protein
MEKQQQVASQPFQRNVDNISRTRQARMTVPYAPLGLKTTRP